MLNWYWIHGRSFAWRSESASIYQRIVSELLLQRTRAEVVESFFPAFLKRFPCWASIANTSLDEIEAVVKPIGLWKRRSIALKLLAEEIDKKEGIFPVNREEIEQLPGIGQYIANAIQLFCYGQPQPLLDINMARVLERHFGPRDLADIRHDKYLQDISHRVVNSQYSKEINWAILDLSALVCKKSSQNHELCPVKDTCKYILS